MLNNVKEKSRIYWEKNRYAIVYGAYCGGCVLAGYMLGKHIAEKRIDFTLSTLITANPDLIPELTKARDALIDIANARKTL